PPGPSGVAAPCHRRGAGQSAAAASGPVPPGRRRRDRPGSLTEPARAERTHAGLRPIRRTRRGRPAGDAHLHGPPSADHRPGTTFLKDAPSLGSLERLSLEVSASRGAATALASMPKLPRLRQLSLANNPRLSVEALARAPLLDGLEALHLSHVPLGGPALEA